jgi:hypothetical protein
VTRYLKRPPVGAQLENGRYGLVTVEQVQQNGLVLIVRTSNAPRTGTGYERKDPRYDGVGRGRRSGPCRP